MCEAVDFLPDPSSSFKREGGFFVKGGVCFGGGGGGMSILGVGGMCVVWVCGLLWGGFFCL